MRAGSRDWHVCPSSLACFLDAGPYRFTNARQLGLFGGIYGQIPVGIGDSQFSERRPRSIGNKIVLPQDAVKPQLVEMCRVFKASLMVNDVGVIGGEVQEVQSSRDLNFVGLEPNFGVRSWAERTASLFTAQRRRAHGRRAAQARHKRHATKTGVDDA